MSKRDLIETYIGFYNTFNIDEMVNMFTDDCTFENVSGSAVTYKSKGKEELRNISSKSVAYFKERKQVVTNWVIDDHKAAVEIEYHAVLASDLPNGLKKGTALKLKGVSFYEFEDDKIKRLVDYS